MQLCSADTPISNSSDETVTYYLEVYAGLALLNSCLTLARAFLFAYAGIKAARVMHEKLIKTIIYVSDYCLTWKLISNI